MHTFLRFWQRAGLATAGYLLGCALLAVPFANEGVPGGYVGVVYRFSLAGLVYAVPIILLVGFSKPTARFTASRKGTTDDYPAGAETPGANLGMHGEFMKNGHDLSGRPFGMSDTDSYS